MATVDSDGEDAGSGYTYRKDMVEKIREALLNYAPIREGVQDEVYRKAFERLCHLIEHGVMNEALRRCSAAGIKGNTEEERFQEMYQFSAFSPLANLDPESSVNRDLQAKAAAPHAEVSAARPESFLARRAHTYLLLKVLLQEEYGKAVLPPEWRYLLRHILYPKGLAGAPPAALNPSADLVIRRIFQERSRVESERAYSTAYTCGRCGERKTIPQPKQIRRADEAPSLRIECIHCGHKWTL